MDPIRNILGSKQEKRIYQRGDDAEAYIVSILHSGSLEISWVRDQLVFTAWVKEGGCLAFGTMGCVECEIARWIPREGCDPPDECAGCESREACPCVCEEMRERLLKSLDP